ncbi:MAG: lamin tail domain-containing protein, partial [Verrucomicrobiota bacterium]|nr:lamin tail domain-containing protein [Verrucomicrobiota bacterium]
MLVPAGAFAAGDTDGDGLPDEWEILNFGDLDENEIGDLEPDGLTNIQEFNRNTDPNDADSDDDGIDDGPEFNIHRTDPADADSDDDGLSDGMELGTYNTDPLADDSDNDGLSDGAEINTHSTSPRLEDSDGDGFNDGMEISAGSDPVDPGSRPDFSNLSNVVINEFMAQNRSTLLDEDGESSDWIELWNPNHQPVPITGWYLTDDPDDLSKWTFPVHTMDGNSFLVLFASTKDRTVSGNELHTSFALEKRGGFLALTRPAGPGEVEIGHQFNPYAAQTEDVSFGLYGNDEPLQSGFF